METAQATGTGRQWPPSWLSRGMLVREVWLVFALSFGASGVHALLDLVDSLTTPRALPSQHAVLNGSVTPDRPWLDLAFQLFFIANGIIPILLVAHMLHRSGESFRDIGIDRRRPRRDILTGIVLAAAVGGAGLVLYFGARAAGANLTVVPTSLRDVWWRIPVLVLSAAQNGFAEETLVAGYLLRRLAQFGWGENRALLTSAVLRGSYHLYQGFGGFVGNFAMGLIFGRLFQRTGRALPLAIAHTIMDTTVFVGYVLLAGHVSWIPT